MAQHLVKGNSKWQWIQLKRKIGPTDWTYKEISQSNRKKPGFHTKIEFEPKLSKESRISYNRDGYDFYHKTITSEIFVGLTNNETGTDLSICYIPMSSNRKDTFLHGYKEPKQVIYSCYRSYAWMFDICLVKMVFRNDTDNTKSITKNFHLECGTGNCKYQDHTGTSQDERAHFTLTEFISIADLEDKIGYHREEGKAHFATLDIEFRARLYLRPFLPDFKVMETDGNCWLDISAMQFFQSDKLAVSDLNPFLPCAGSRILSSNMCLASDLTFKLKSAPFKMLHAHSFVLAAQSPVFRQMLSTEMLEKKTGIIKLEDDETTPESLKIFLTYLYGRMCLSYSENWTVKLSIGVLKLAHRYQVFDLTEFCLENIISRPDMDFNIELAIQIFEAGKLYENEDLCTRSVQWAERQNNEVKINFMELLKGESQPTFWSLMRVLFH